MKERRNRGYVYREEVGAVPPGTSVLEYLTRRYRHSPEKAWRERIREGRVLVDGRAAEPGDRLRPGATLAWARPPWVEPAVPDSIELLHEDAHLLAVDKPAGLPTHAGGGYLEHTLLALVRARHPGAVAVHRLGRWTSGVVLFAKTAAARSHLAREFRLENIEKRYLTLAAGRPAAATWTVDVPIGPVPHPRLGTVHAASPGGRPARSDVTVLRDSEGGFLAGVRLVTGRPHQVRIHLAASGHPLVGDRLYGVGGVPLAESPALPGDPGYRLHAVEVRGIHPGGGEFRILSPPADEMLRNPAAVP